MNTLLKAISKSLNDYFAISKNHSSIKTEITAGLTTFFTMAYIIFVNPTILSASGMNFGAAFTATCLSAALGSLLIGLYANYPIAIAPSMGLNVYFTYVVVKHLGFSWQAALGMVFIAGVLFLVLTLSNIREKLVRSIPTSLAIGIASGIGLLLAAIALKNLNGNLQWISGLLVLFGILLIIFLNYKKVPGAILLSIFVITFISLILGLIKFHGIFSAPVPIKPIWGVSHLKYALYPAGLIAIFTFFIVALFDSTGTLIGLLEETKDSNDLQRTKQLSKALMADSIATIAGSLLGTSTVSPYVESAAGISAGGRTGLTAIIVAILFLFALVLSPLAQSIPQYATTPALLFVAYLMVRNIRKLNWRDMSEVIPALATMITIPVTFSIANGVGIGIISYIVMKYLLRKRDQINLSLCISASVFIIYFLIQLL